ncbi:F-box/FBD/LRR-repeat protein At5g44980-like [Vicia villosa]|uniref:F-box/FBD/LRR-repeat protein At5g44980-like n=1 Tax=Vicia villosa TaxID=3911 RepID=UPI00273AC329|nr:F-box/FBD/LRR-repeat protein At5g44980-like [Vicia villosa]
MFLDPESNMVDYISELPDDVLSYILKSISLKDLLKISILSKRWCKLWTLRKDIYFDIFNVFEETVEKLLQTGYLIDVPDSPMCDEETEKELLQAGYDIPDRPIVRRLTNLNTIRDEFVKRVDQFVKNFHGTKIDSFLVKFYLNCDQSAIIDQWITFALAREVERIDLLFLGLPYAQNNLRNFYKFPLDLLLETKASTLKHLSLECCLIRHPTNNDFSPLKKLRFLSLNHVKLDEIFIETLLSNCGLLEELHLFSCNFTASMPKIVSSSLLILKIINGYISPRINSLVEVDLTLLDCLKLTSLEYDGYGLHTMNINTPMLKCIDFFISYEEDLNIFDLFATFLQLETMRINITSTVSHKVL